MQVSLPVVEEQQDSNATVTALSLFASCPRKYYLSRYLGFEGRPRKPGEAALASGEPADLSAAEFGTQVHALLAGNPVPEPAPEALRLAEVFRQSPLGRRAARATRVAREFDFLMAMEDLVIRGQVDLWFEEGGELVVVDYKTDEVTTAEGPSSRPGLRAATAPLRARRGARGRPRPRPRLAPLPASQHPGGSGPDPYPNRKSRTDRSGLSGSAIQTRLSADRRRAVQALSLLPGPLPGRHRMGHFRSGSDPESATVRQRFLANPRRARTIFSLWTPIPPIFFWGCSICWKTSCGKLAEIFTTLPLVVTLTDLISAAALASRPACICAMLISNFATSPSVVAFCAVSHCASPLNTTCAPNFTPPAADCTFCPAFIMGFGLPALAGGARLAGGTVVMPQASCELLHWFTLTATSAGRDCLVLKRSMAPLTLAISPAATVVASRKAMPASASWVLPEW